MTIANKINLDNALNDYGVRHTDVGTAWHVDFEEADTNLTDEALADLKALATRFDTSDKGILFFYG